MICMIEEREWTIKCWTLRSRRGVSYWFEIGNRISIFRLLSNRSYDLTIISPEYRIIHGEKLTSDRESQNPIDKYLHQLDIATANSITTIFWSVSFLLNSIIKYLKIFLNSTCSYFFCELRIPYYT